MTVVTLTKGDSLHSSYTDGLKFNQNLNMHVLFLLSLELVASILTGRYVLETVKIILHTLTYFHTEDGGKGILVYSASVLVTCFRKMSLTCSFIV